MGLEQKIIQTASNLNPDTIRLLTSSIEGNTTLIRWAFGICVTGFFTICGWLFMLTRNVQNQKVLTDNITKIAESMTKIEIALIGDYGSKGLITKHEDLEKDVHRIKEKLNA